MSHLYPIAANADEALNNAKLAALTRYEAEALAGGLEILKLETEWLTPVEGNAMSIMDAADAGVGQGFVQQYENEAGEPVLAVTYWKTGTKSRKNSKKTNKEPVSSSDEDHTDDLYFRGGRTKPSKKRWRKRYIDPRQLDLFMSNDDKASDSSD